MHGMPARKVGANFSSRPQTGKLNALMCTATPRRGTRMCVPAKPPFLPSDIAGPSCTTLPDGSSLPPIDGVGEQRAAAAFDVDPAVAARRAGVAPTPRTALPCARSGTSASAFRRAARCWKSSASSVAAAGAARERQRLGEVELVGVRVVDAPPSMALARRRPRGCRPSGRRSGFAGRACRWRNARRGAGGSERTRERRASQGWYFQAPFSIFTMTRARWSRPR